MKFNFFIMSLLVSVSAYGIPASNTAQLNLAVTGSISPIPVWNVDGSDVANGYTVTYHFSSYTGGATANSATHVLKLKNPTSSTTLHLVLPKTCTVGSTAVGINFIENSTILAADALLSTTIFNEFTAGSTTFMQLTGLTTTTSGNVACATNGSLTYTY